jgi:pyridinium-3,5-bisthiocarboxylic acid mononucleotide nickel chelatase
MKVLYFDLIGGASGDMILAALIDAGVPADKLAEMLTGLKLDEFELKSASINKNGFQATKVDIQVGKQPPERHLKEILDVIQNSSLPGPIRDRATKIFQKIAAVEAGIHNKPVDQIHLHELGSTDTIVDVTGALLALDYLGVSHIYASPIPLGSGFIDGAHGQIPLPAPATIALLKGLPVRKTEIKAELITPTGAALLAELVDDFSPPPEMTIDKIGYGAGTRDLPIPNLLRVMIGEIAKKRNQTLEKLILLESNLDDMNPEIYPYVMNLLFNAGALDVCLLPVQMKKNRPGTQIQVLVNIQNVQDMKDILFQETSTLGIRQTLVDRYSLPRIIQEVSTTYGVVRIKVAGEGTNYQKVSPEFEDCQKLARENHIPIQKVYQEAIKAYYEGNN